MNKIKKVLSDIKWCIDMKLFDVFAPALFAVLKMDDMPYSQRAIFKVNDRRWWFNPIPLPITYDEVVMLENEHWRLPSVEEFMELNKNVTYGSTEHGSVVIRFTKGYVCFFTCPKPKRKDALQQGPPSFWVDCARDNRNVTDFTVCKLVSAEAGFQPFRENIKENTPYEARVILISRK